MLLGTVAHRQGIAAHLSREEEIMDSTLLLVLVVLLVLGGGYGYSRRGR